MIEITNLSKTYYNNGQPLEVLKGIDCTINKGEIVSIIGPSGTGKSTFLRCINRLDEPTGGQIIFDGENILDPKVDINRVRRKMGIVFQSFNLFEHFTILENVTFGPIKVLGMKKAEAEERAMELLRTVGMAEKANVYPSSLSGGQKQRVAIARCLSMEPKCILFDEPTSALDPTMVGEVLSVIRQLASMGMTMLIVTHEMKFAHDVSTRILFMYGGGIYEDGTPQQIFEHPQKPETIAFIQRIRTLHYDLNTTNSDLYAINTDIDKFCLKYGVERQKFTLQLIFEELMFNILKDYRPISVDISFSELDYSLSMKVLVKGATSSVLNDADELSLSIIKGKSKEVKETVTDEGLLIEIK